MHYAGWLSVLALMFSGAQGENALPRYGIFVYSNRCISEESGDIYGDEIILIRQASGDEVIWQEEDQVPVIAYGPMIKIYPQTSSFRIDAPNEIYPQKPVILTGIVGDNELTLSVQWEPSDSAPKPTKLARVRDFGAKIGKCR